MKDYNENNNIENNINEEKIEKKQKRDNTFNIIIGISTLIIAIFGATFAYFSATASSKENDVNVRSANVSINYIGGTKIEATNLIPSSERVAIAMFQKSVQSIGTYEEGAAYLKQDEYTNDTSRRCVDVNGREVCSVYQFQVKSEGENGETTNITGGIKIENNQFPENDSEHHTNLSYVVYEVEFDTKNGDVLVDKFGHEVIKNYTPLNVFKNIDTNPDHQDIDPNYSSFEKDFDNRTNDQESVFISKVNPIACLFGYLTEDELREKYADGEEYKKIGIDDMRRCRTLPIENNKEHTYQVMIWLLETGNNQPEQGLAFQGTVNLEVPGGTGNYPDGRITGKGS